MPLEPLASIVADPDWKDLSPEDQAEIRLKYAQKVAAGKAKSGPVAKSIDTALDFAGSVAKKLMPFPGLIHAYESPETLPQVEIPGGLEKQPAQFGFQPQLKSQFERPPALPTGGTPNVIAPEATRGVQQKYPASYVENAPRVPRKAIDMGYLLNPIPTGVSDVLNMKVGPQVTPGFAKAMEDIPMGLFGAGPLVESAARSLGNLPRYFQRRPAPGPATPEIDTGPQFTTARDVTPGPFGPGGPGLLGGPTGSVLEPLEFTIPPRPSPRTTMPPGVGSVYEDFLRQREADIASGALGRAPARAPAPDISEAEIVRPAQAGPPAALESPAQGSARFFEEQAASQKAFLQSPRSAQLLRHQLLQEEEVSGQAPEAPGKGLQPGKAPKLATAHPLVQDVETKIGAIAGKYNELVQAALNHPVIQENMGKFGLTEESIRKMPEARVEFEHGYIIAPINEALAYGRKHMNRFGAYRETKPLSPDDDFSPIRLSYNFYPSSPAAQRMQARQEKRRQEALAKSEARKLAKQDEKNAAKTPQIMQPPVALPEPPVLSAPEVIDKIESQQDPEHFDKPQITEQVGQTDYVKTKVPPEQLETRPGVEPGAGKPEKGAVVADESGKVIDGNHRVEDAKAAGEPTIPAYVPAGSDLAPPQTAEPELGQAIRVMGVDAELVRKESIGGMRYELYHGRVGRDNRAAIRVVDEDSGNVTNVVRHPSRESADSSFNDVIAAAQKTSGKPPAPQAPAAEPAPEAKSYAAEMNDGSGWGTNALRFATREEAEAYADDLFSRWMGARDKRVVESNDPVNRAWREGKLQDVEQPPAPDISMIKTAEEPLAPPTEEKLQDALGNIDQYIKDLGRLRDAKELRDYARELRDWIMNGREGDPPPEPARDRLIIGDINSKIIDFLRPFEFKAPTFQEEPGKVPQAQLDAAQAVIDNYIRPIKNEAKRQYAAVYLNWVVSGRQGDPPDHPNLGTMAAQAVRMEIDKRMPLAKTPEGVQSPVEVTSGPSNENAPELAHGQRAGESPPTISERPDAGSGGPVSEGPTTGHTVHGGIGTSGSQPLGGGGPSGGTAPSTGGPAQPGIPGPAPTQALPEPAPEDIGPVGGGGGGNLPELAEEGGQPAPEDLIPITLPEPNYSLPKDRDWLPRSAKARVDANVKAVQILHELEQTGRQPSPEEQDALSKYVGWGGLKQALDTGKAAYREKPPRYQNQQEEWQNWEKAWGKQYDQVKAALTPDEYRSAKQSIDTQHYTSRVVINGIWKAVERLGFKGGNALEPAVGVGNFIGLTPDELTSKIKWRGIDIDNIAARIAQVLYPQAKIDNSPYEKAKVGPNTQSLVISNVPFSDTKVDDERFPYLSLHNYYFMRSIDAVKPGGVVAFITSSYTMDAPTTAPIRKTMADKADLLGAIRLPNNAFEENAGTEVTTDIVFLRKKDGTSFPSERWDGVTETKTYDGRPITVNEYYVAHPEMLLGRLSLEGTMYAKDQPALLPTPGKSLEVQLGEAVQNLPQNVVGKQELTPIDLSLQGGGEGGGGAVGRPGNYAVQGNTIVKISQTGTPLKPTWATTRTAVQQAEKFIELREARKVQVATEINPEMTDEDVERGRARLAQQYNDYLKKYGPINGLGSKFLRDDDDFVHAGSLERPVYSFRTSTTGKQQKKTDWVPADILTKRTGWPRVPPSRVDNIPDATEVSFNFKGEAVPEYISELTGVPADQVARYLEQNGLAYQDPADGLWYAGPEYLSGFVKEKLKAAQEAAKDDPRYAVHVAELEKVQPKRVSILQASITLGADWIPPNTVARWAEGVLQQRNLRITYTPATATWHVEEPNALSAANTTTWGVINPSGNSLSGGQIIADSLNGRPSIVWDTYRDEHGTLRYTRNDDLTIDARAKQARLKKEFAQWARTTQGVAQDLEDRYNERQNFATLPQFRGPSWTYYPGATNTIALRDDQKAAVTRALKQSLGLFHAPGNGKTYIMTTIAMEARRLGIARKPMIVVHNSTAEQFPAMAQRLYPNAKIMYTGEHDFDPDKRKATMARIATGDWDMVILPQSQYDKIAVDNVRVERWILDQLDELERARIEMARVEGENSPQVRDIVRAQRRFRKQLDKLAASKTDTHLKFEDLGIDYLMVDEFHAYKKLAFYSNRPNIKGLDRSFSKRGFANKMKMLWVQEHANGKNTLGATGTPISNTSAEAWNMMRYLRPDVLAKYGIELFDQFASTYGDTKTDIELTAGGSWKEDTRFTGYTNALNLVKAWKESADVVTQDMVKLQNLPVIKGGATQSIEVEQTPELSAAINWIRSQLEGYARVTGRQRRELNWIPGTMYTMGKKSAIDMRLVDPSLPDNPKSKLNRAVTEIQRMYKQYDAANGTIWVFLDMKNDRAKNPTFNAHKEIERKLIAGGIPANEIAVFDDKMKGARRASVREMANEGKIRVLIGHSDTLGTGFDASGHAVGLIHIDTPDTPAKMEQRTARVIRQGNEIVGPGKPYEAVEIISLGVTGSLDAARFQMLTRKQAQLNQLMRGEFQGNYVEDPTDDVFLDFQQQLAQYSGNPAAYQRFKLENEIKTLEALQGAHAEQVNRSGRELIELRDHQIPTNQRLLAAAQKTAAEFQGVFDKGFVPVLEMGGETYTGQNDVEKAIEAKTIPIMEGVKDEAVKKGGTLRREIGGFILNGKEAVADVESRPNLNTSKGNSTKDWFYEPGDSRILWRFKDGPSSYNSFTTGHSFLFQNVPAQVERIMNEPGVQKTELDAKLRNALELKNFVEGPFQQAGELAEKRGQLNDVINALQAAGNDVEPGQTVTFNWGGGNAQEPLPAVLASKVRQWWRWFVGRGVGSTTLEGRESAQGLVREVANGFAIIEPTEENWAADRGLAPEQALTIPLVDVSVIGTALNYPLAIHPAEQRESVRAAIREELHISQTEADPKARALMRSLNAAIQSGETRRANILREQIDKLYGGEDEEEEEETANED